MFSHLNIILPVLRTHRRCMILGVASDVKLFDFFSSLNFLLLAEGIHIPNQHIEL